MRILVLSDHTRHELGCAAALKSTGFDVFYVNVGAIYPYFNMGAHLVNVYSREGDIPVKFKSIRPPGTFFSQVLSTSAAIEDAGIPDLAGFDFVVASPQTPFYLGARISRDLSIPLILRIHTVKNTKMHDYIRIGRNSEIVKYLPSFLHSAFQISIASKSVVLDHVVKEFLSRVIPADYPLIYPTYAAVFDKKMEEEARAKGFEIDFDAFEGQRNVLAIASYNAGNPSLRFESELIDSLIRIAKENPDANVLVLGTSVKDFAEIPGRRKPHNLKPLGRVYSDIILRKVYESADIVICPIMQRAISNRLLEGLFYAKPILTNSVSAQLHTEVKHGENVLICDRLTDYARVTSELLHDDNMLELLSKGARRLFEERFSITECGSRMREVLSELAR